VAKIGAKRHLCPNTPSPLVGEGGGKGKVERSTPVRGQTAHTTESAPSSPYPFSHATILSDVTKNALIALAIGLALASIVLSVLFKGVFLVLLIPAFFAWNGSRRKGDR
jgi:hypothetical protein